MLKNTAGQTFRVFAFADAGHASLDPGEPVTGDAANITCKLSLDGGALAATTDTNPTELESGFYEFAPTQAETNADEIVPVPVSATAGVQVVAVPRIINTITPAPTASENATAVRTELTTELDRIDASIASRSSHTVSNVWEHASRTLSAFAFSVTVGTNNDKAGYGLSASERTALAAALEAAIINELDGAAVMQAIADLIADDMTTGDLSVQAIASAVRSVILAGDSSPIATANNAIANVQTTENLSNYDWATSGEVSAVDSKVETLANDQATAFGNLNDLSQAQAQTAATAAVADIKAKTDQLTFTEANKVDANADVTVTGDVQIDSDAIATALREKLAALVVWLSSPHDQETGELKLAASTEYKTGGPLGPLSFKLTNASVADSDAVRFVAQLTTDNGTEQIDLAGTVTLDGSDYFATFEIDATDLDVTPSVAWRYSVLHGTGPAAIIADQPLAVLPSRLPAA